MLMDAAAILKLMHDGGHLAMTALVVAAWWYERKQSQALRDDNKALQEKLFELASAQIQSNLKHEAALDALKSVLHSLLNKD